MEPQHPRRSRIGRRNPSRRPLTAAALLTTTVSILTGCSDITDPYPITGPADTAKALTHLRTLPSSRQTEATIKTTVEQLGARIAGLVPSMNWQWDPYTKSGVTGCNPPYDSTGGDNVMLPNYVATTPIPANTWKKVLQQAQHSAASLGAHHAEAFLNRDDDHDATFYNPDPTGSALQIASAVNTVIAAATGCRLPETTTPPP